MACRDDVVLNAANTPLITVRRRIEDAPATDFQVESPLGYRIVLTRDRWREIVRYKHPAFAGEERQLRACVESSALC
jgi:hypothetical protein